MNWQSALRLTGKKRLARVLDFGHPVHDAGFGGHQELAAGRFRLHA
jgi:hypothetical protein